MFTVEATGHELRAQETLTVGSVGASGADLRDRAAVGRHITVAGVTDPGACHLARQVRHESVEPVRAHRPKPLAPGVP